MKVILFALFTLTCTIGLAALNGKPAESRNSSAAQAMCMPGDTARGCWHSLEHRLN